MCGDEYSVCVPVWIYFANPRNKLSFLTVTSRFFWGTVPLSTREGKILCRTAAKTISSTHHQLRSHQHTHICDCSEIEDVRISRQKSHTGRSFDENNLQERENSHFPHDNDIGHDTRRDESGCESGGISSHGPDARGGVRPG